MSDVYILRKLRGLGELKTQDGFTTFSAKTQGENVEGINEGKYRGRTLPGAEVELSFAWSTLTDSFCFAGTAVDLQEIVRDLRLKFEKGHRKEGETITYDDVDLKDFLDPFMRHTFWDGKRYAVDGECLLKTSIPEERMFILAYKGNTQDCVDREVQEGFNAWESTARWELISPKTSEKKKAKDINKTINILSEINNLDVATREMFCIILNLDYDKENKEDTTLSALFEGTNNPAKQSRLLGMTIGEKLEQLLKLPKDKITIYSDVVQAMQVGILRNNGTNFTFNTENKKAKPRIDVGKEVELPDFFSLVDNQDQYLILREELQKRIK